MRDLLREAAYTACFFGLLFVAYKLGQAREIVRALDERADSPARGGNGDPRSSSVFDGQAESANGLYMTLLGRTVDFD